MVLHVEAGGSGLNTVVIVNQNSAQSCELGNYFCERRQVPPDNVLRINWAGGNTSWSSGDFQTNLVTPLLDMLAARQLTNQIDYVVLSMDIPFQTVYDTNKVNSTTSALFYGLKDDTGPNWMDVTNSYAASSEQIFRQARPASAPGYAFLTTMLTAGSLAQAKLLVDQGVASDSTFPAQHSILAKSSDPLRNVRYHEFDNSIFNAQLWDNCALLRTNTDSPCGQTNLMGYQTGLASFNISPNTFVPGRHGRQLDFVWRDHFWTERPNHAAGLYQCRRGRQLWHRNGAFRQSPKNFPTRRTTFTSSAASAWPNAITKVFTPRIKDLLWANHWPRPSRNLLRAAGSESQPTPS